MSGIKIGFWFVLLGMLASCSNGPLRNPRHKDTSWAMIPFVKLDSVNPVLQPRQDTFTDPVTGQLVHWDSKYVFNPAAVVRHDSIYLIFRAMDSTGPHAGTSRLGIAVSVDGMHFRVYPTPVLFPDRDTMNKYEWPGGVEDPRIVQSPDSTYLLTYTAYDGKTARLCLATSKDLLHWTKQGLVFKNPAYRDLWSKSGAILAQQNGSRIVAVPIQGWYWMYWGDTNIFIARSKDLLHWEPMNDGAQIKSLMGPRTGFFDSRLVESGPYALYRDSGILFMYNSMNDSAKGDKSLAPHAYSAGQVWIDSKHPDRVLQRLDSNFIRPDKPYEINGQVDQVCFIEGLVPWNNSWHLYYGTADSKIATAVYHP